MREWLTLLWCLVWPRAFKRWRALRSQCEFADSIIRRLDRETDALNAAHKDTWRALGDASQKLAIERMASSAASVLHGAMCNDDRVFDAYAAFDVAMDAYKAAMDRHRQAAYDETAREQWADEYLGRPAQQPKQYLSHPPEFYEADTKPNHEIPEPDTTVTEVDVCGCEESIMLREQLREDAELRRVCEEWRDSHKPTEGDDLHKNGEIHRSLPWFGEAVLDVIGYYDA